MGLNETGPHETVATTSAADRIDLRQVVAPTGDANLIHPGLNNYLEAISAHWPGLTLSMARGRVSFSSYRAGFRDMATVLGALVDTAEDVRVRRRADGDLACAVMAVVGPETDYAARWVMDFPRWLALNLYAPVGLIFALAAIGESIDDTDGPTAPVSFFAVRSSSPSDVDILSSDPALRHLTPSTSDDGRDVLRPLIGRPASGRAAATRFPTLALSFPLPKP